MNLCPLTGTLNEMIRTPNNRFSRIIVLLLAPLLHTCITPYDPDVSDYENLLVVDGVITDGPGDHFVYLSRSYPYNELSGEVPEAGAVVSISDDRGNMAFLEETEPGTYLLKQGDLDLQTGSSYQLSLELADGDQYASGFETMMPAGTLDSVYYELIKADPAGNGYPEDGIQVFLDATGAKSEGGGYKWSFTETWEYTVPYAYAGGSKFRCWTETHSRGIHIASASGFTGESIQRRKLQFIPFSVNKLYIDYSLVVRQYSLNGNAFEFYNALETLMEEPKTVFGQIPFSLYSNIENLDDPDDQVLGFFQVSGVTDQRISINRADLPKTQRISTGNEDCIALPAPDYRVSLTWYRIIYPGTDPFYINRMGCADCTLTGSNVRPGHLSTLSASRFF